MIKKIVFFLVLGTCKWALALSLPTTVFVLESNKDFASRPFGNDSSTTKFYQVKVRKVSSPAEDEVELPLLDGEVLYAPLSVVLEGNGRDVFKFYYRGPKDDQERYYRVLITEKPFSAVEKTTLDEKHIKFTDTSLALSTYIVVRPRKIRMEYSFDENTGYFKNTGNTFLRLVLNGSCQPTANAQLYDLENVYDILPGEEFKADILKHGFRKSIVFNGFYHALGTKCDSSDGK